MTTAEDVQRSFHYLYPQELPALKMLVLQLPPQPLVINIGAGAGTSGLAIMESREDAWLATIDIQDASSPYGCLEGERQVMTAAGYGDMFGFRWFQVHADSKEVGRNYRFWFANVQKMPNMVFIDGDHSYEGCKGDIEAWLPHIAPGGIIAVHDYLKENLQADPNGPHPMPWPGVDSAVNELLVPNFEMILHVASLIAFKV
jgi:predicted O-methyltransferase YrrM